MVILFSFCLLISFTQRCMFKVMQFSEHLTFSWKLANHAAFISFNIISVLPDLLGWTQTIFDPSAAGLMHVRIKWLKSDSAWLHRATIGNVTGKRWSKKSSPHLTNPDTLSLMSGKNQGCATASTVLLVSKSLYRPMFHRNYFVIFSAPVIVQMKSSAGRITTEIYIIIIILSVYFVLRQSFTK